MEPWISISHRHFIETIPIFICMCQDIFMSIRFFPVMQHRRIIQHGMKCGYMNFINTGKINVPSDAECIFEHIFYKAMVQILEYYLQQPIEIVREKLGVYIDYIQEEDLKFSEFGEKIAKRLSDEK